MTGRSETVSTDPVDLAYSDGRRCGLAMGALSVSAVAFISLLGVEKAVLALALATLALSGSQGGTRARRLSVAAMVLACIYVITYVLVIVLYHQKLAELLHMMQQLG